MKDRLRLKKILAINYVLENRESCVFPISTVKLIKLWKIAVAKRLVGYAYIFCQKTLIPGH